MDIKFKSPETVELVSGKNELLSDNSVKLLNYRIEQEEMSSRIYLAMSLWLNNNGYLGGGKLWEKYSKEELTHADWARDYLLAMGVTPSTPALTKVQETFTGLPEIIQKSYAHEIVITKQCKALAAACLKEGDFMLYELAMKYLHEQVEEHEKMQDLVDRINAFGTDKIALRLLDEELAELAE